MICSMKMGRTNKNSPAHLVFIALKCACLIRSFVVKKPTFRCLTSQGAELREMGT